MFARLPPRAFLKIPRTMTIDSSVSSVASASLSTSSPANHFPLAISRPEDDASIRERYRPFLLSDEVMANDWISRLELDAVEQIVAKELDGSRDGRLKILVLYGSLRKRYGYSHSPSLIDLNLSAAKSFRGLQCESRSNRKRPLAFDFLAINTL